MPPTAPPLYLDWMFWTAIVAVAALVLSQIPPIRVLVRRTRVQVEPYDRLEITHWLGNPNVNLHVQLTNVGGRKVRVMSLVLVVSSDDGAKLTMPAQTFSRQDGTKASILFTRLALDTDEEWANYVSFFAQFSMTDENRSKQLTKELRTDINNKLRTRTAEEVSSAKLMEADPKFVTQILAFYADHKKWRSGEYSAELTMHCEPKSASQTRKFRFTLFEADVQELDERCLRYKYGAGVYFTDPDVSAVFPRIKDFQ